MRPGLIGVLLLSYLPIFSQQDQSTVVEGVVRDSVTHAGIPGVDVTLFGKLLETPREVQTDASGRYRFDNIKAGTYGLRQEKGSHFNPAPEGRTEFTATAPSTRRDLELTPWSNWNGRVLDPFGSPVAGIRVSLVPLPLYGGTKSGEDPITDAEGRFVFDRLLPGSYMIRADPSSEGGLRMKSKAPGSTHPTSNDSGEFRTEIVATYFPGVANLAEAEKQPALAGANLTLPDLRLRRVPVYRVSGVALKPDGKPAQFVSASLSSGSSRFPIGFGNREGREFIRPGEATSQGDTLTATVDGAGGFEFLSVPEGEWQLLVQTNLSMLDGSQMTRFDPAVMASLRSYRAAVAVQVAGRDFKPIELRLEEPFSVTVASGGGEDSEMLLTSVEGPPAFNLAMGRNGTKRWDAVTPGTYRVFAVTNRPGAYVSTIRIGGIDITTQPIRLSTAPAPIQVNLKEGAAKVIGTTEKGVPGRVLLWTETADGDPGLVSSVATDTLGNFQASGLRPGDYHAIALDKVEATKLTFAKLRQLSTKATRFKVDEGSTATLRLSIQPW